MLRVRALLTLAALLVAMARAAWAQPVDPYQQPAPAPSVARPAAPPAPVPDAPQDPYAPAPAEPAADPRRIDRLRSAAQQGSEAPCGEGSPCGDPLLTDRVAEALVARAQELLDRRVFLDAKQLAVEALVQSPKGSAAARASAIIHAVNLQLGIPEDSPRPEPTTTEAIDTSPIQDPTLSSGAVVPPAEGKPSGRLAARVHGGLYAGLIGTTVGAFLSDDAPANGAVPVGIAVGLAGALALPRLTDKLRWSEPRLRTIGAATVWGGVVGGLFGDIARTEGTSAREVLVAASVGSTLAGLGGYALTRQRQLTPGDVALVDTFAGIGAIGGLTLGMVMQPAQSEAYSLNSVIGVAGGVAVGIIAGPRTHTTPRGMLRVAGLAAVGAGAPFLLYAAIRDGSSTADERITGLLSTGGLVVGAYLGFRFTRGMDGGRDTLDGKLRKAAVDDAPIALVGRSSAGRWGLGGLGVLPLSPALAPQHGMALQLLGAAF